MPCEPCVSSANAALAVRATPETAARSKAVSRYLALLHVSGVIQFPSVRLIAFWHSHQSVQHNLYRLLTKIHKIAIK